GFIAEINFFLQLNPRQMMTNFKAMLKASERMGRRLARARSPYLRELGGVLSATYDDSSGLRIAHLSQAILGQLNVPLLNGLLDSFGYTNLVFFPQFQLLRRRLHRFGVVGSAMGEVDSLMVFASLEQEPAGPMTEPKFLPPGHSARFLLKSGANMLMR